MDGLIDLTDDGDNDLESGEGPQQQPLEEAEQPQQAPPAAAAEAPAAVEVVDLADTDDDEEEPHVPLASKETAYVPIGTEISADVVDLEDDSDEEEDVTRAAQAHFASAPPAPVRATQKHPRTYIEAARKRKREKALAKKLEDLRLQQEKRRAAAFDPKNIPGGCNFVVIDDDDDSSDEQGKPKASTQCASGLKPAAAQNWSPEEVQREQAKPSWKRARVERRPTTTKRRVPIPNENVFCQQRDYNFHISQEAALEMQERMFRESAARVRATQPTQPLHRNVAIVIVTPMFDVADRHPDHWRWKEPFACLGLPRDSSITLIKSQYRRLAKLYHPDKSAHANASDRFHGIALAYRKLTQND